uniref:Movement protein n=1 Tax=Globodera pallida TaxID=36090 RepID=A0A183BNY9_GLOPA
MPSSMRSSSSGSLFHDKPDARRTLVDYKDFSSSSSLSPYMYRAGSGQGQLDSRIVGSNFVQVSRPKDRFLEKIEQTLAEVRNSPRYTLI